MKRIFNFTILITVAILVLLINHLVLSSEAIAESIYQEQPTILSNLTISRINYLHKDLGQIQVGDTYSYTLTITNHGDKKATEVVLQEDFGGWGIIAEQITINHTQGTISFERGGKKNIAIVHLSEILPKQQVEVNVIVRANGAGKNTTESIVTSKENPLPRRLFTKIVTKPKPVDPYDLEIIQSVDNQNPAVGEIINIIVYLLNNGPGTASSVEVRLSLPKQLEVIGVEPQYSSYDSNKNTWRINVIAENTSNSLRIRAKVTEADAFSSIAEVISADFQDIDSIANNGEKDEDDYSILNLNSLNPYDCR